MRSVNCYSCKICIYIPMIGVVDRPARPGKEAFNVGSGFEITAGISLYMTKIVQPGQHNPLTFTVENLRSQNLRKILEVVGLFSSRTLCERQQPLKAVPGRGPNSAGQAGCLSFPPYAGGKAVDSGENEVNDPGNALCGRVGDAGAQCASIWPTRPRPTRH